MISQEVKNRIRIPPIKENFWLRFLYETKSGRMCLKILVRPSISKMASRILDSPLSIPVINIFIKSKKIKMEEYENVKYKSFNDFFTRKIKSTRRPIDVSEKHFISPCDAKLSLYKINRHSTFFIKQARYSVKELVEHELLSKTFDDGYCLVFRLEVSDYHHYCYLDDGIKGKNIFISGELHSVKPISLSHYPVYKRNCREYTILETVNWGSVVQIEIGAMFVGKIKNFHESCSFRKGEEKGMFEFGGSTIVLLIKKNMVIFDDDIISNMDNGFETVVKMGEKIGRRKER